MTLSSRGLDRGGFELAGDGPRHKQSHISAAVADENYLLRRGQELREFVFDRFGRNFVAGVEDQKILDAADDAPVAVKR